MLALIWFHFKQIVLISVGFSNQCEISCAQVFPWNKTLARNEYFFLIIGQFTLISAHTLILLGMSVAIKINSHAAEITCSGLLPVLYLVIITQ